jgi:hypothetical protein
MPWELTIVNAEDPRKPQLKLRIVEREEISAVQNCSASCYNFIHE